MRGAVPPERRAARPAARPPGLALSAEGVTLLTDTHLRRSQEQHPAMNAIATENDTGSEFRSVS